MPDPQAPHTAADTALVIGAGPAGLMAAETLAALGHSVTIVDAMPSPGRKFLMAGKSGLNLTMDLPPGAFVRGYGGVPDTVAAAVAAFGPAEVMAWAEGLGQEVFAGTSGRVFPKLMKASPLLRAWLARLGAAGVTLRTRWRWQGWQGDGLFFETPDGPRVLHPVVTILALGGASWKRLGSDGAWADLLPGEVSEFQPANMGFRVDWSAHMAPYFGQPVKGCALMAGQQTTRGEFVVSSRGVEGGGIYAVSRAVRDGSALTIDLCPDLTLDDLRQRLAQPRGKASLSNHLRKKVKLDGVRLALLNEFGRPFPKDLAALIKALPIKHAGPRPIDEAISVAGGLRLDVLDEHLMFRNRPGVFACGEMLDWEAPTGGYLITACLATGRLAGEGAARFLAT